MKIWFISFEHILYASISALFFFCLIVILVRLLGKRITSQMNNFDWIITITIGSLAASSILLRDVSIVDATAAILVLSGCQWLATWAVMRFPFVSKIFKAKPRMLVHKGEFLHEAMKKERISKGEIEARLREKGYTSLEDANWIILESDGSMSVIPRQELTLDNAEMMTNVEGSLTSN